MKPIIDTSLCESPALAGTLDDILAFVKRFVSLSDSQARIVALWAAHTHAFEAAECTPYLAINSAEKQSGKTRLLEVLALLVAKPWMTGRVTAAVLVRKVDRDRATLLLDESDAAFSGEREYAEALRAVLNSGYRRGGQASLCVGQGAKIDFKDFSTFCPKAIAGIGKLPDTVADRSIPIRLKRAHRGGVERFRQRDVAPEAESMKKGLGEWAAANLETLKAARPEIPSALSDRQADCSEPLLAVADMAGGDWPGQARRALVSLCAGAQADDGSLGIQLLRDIRAIFAEQNAEEISSSDLAASLAQIETSPWGEWSKGKPLSPAKLARLLKPFEVYPGKIQDGLVRGYRLAHFQDAFSRYILSLDAPLEPSKMPVSPSQSVQVSASRINTGENATFKVSEDHFQDTSKNSISPNNDAGLGHLDTLRPGIREMEGQKMIQNTVEGVLF